MPILLYHHVNDGPDRGRYYVSIDNFRAQMHYLYKEGYTTITPAYLADVLTKGGELPPKPVIITFDDGASDVIQNALPIMESYGFVGAFYVVDTYVDTEGMITSADLKDLVSRGWEIGSHTKTHADLTKDHDQLYEELSQSAVDLGSITGVKVVTIAYPFGLMDEVVVGKVAEYRFKAAMGLGTLNTHSLGTIYYLSRREVQDGYDLEQFIALLK